MWRTTSPIPALLLLSPLLQGKEPPREAFAATPLAVPFETCKPLVGAQWPSSACPEPSHSSAQTLRAETLSPAPGSLRQPLAPASPQSSGTGAASGLAAEPRGSAVLALHRHLTQLLRLSPDASFQR